MEDGLEYVGACQLGMAIRTDSRFIAVQHVASKAANSLAACALQSPSASLC